MSDKPEKGDEGAEAKTSTAAVAEGGSDTEGEQPAPSIRPSTLSRVAANQKGLKNFFYDPETKSCLGRTCVSWLKIMIFYIIYYAFAFAFALTALFVFLTIIPDKSPVFTARRVFGSVVDRSQGIGYRPKVPLTIEEAKEEYLRSNEIWFKEGSDESALHYISDLLSIMNQEDQMNLRAGCELPGCKVFDPSKAAEWGPCAKPSSPDPNAFGYKAGQPCVMIRINKLIDWNPGTKAISAGQKYDPGYYRWKDEHESTYNLLRNSPGKYIWINCKGEKPADDANIGDIVFYPAAGIPVSFFPYQAGEDWASPYIFVQFRNVRRNVLVHVKCEAYHESLEPKTATVTFGLIVDRASP